MIVYTDGSSAGKIGRAASAALLLYGNNTGLLVARPVSFDTGNNVAELGGILLAMKELPLQATVTLYTDSQNCLGWLAKYWKRNNPDIDKLCAAIERHIYRKQLQVQYLWVKGHSDNIYNNLVDKAAQECKKSGKAIRKVVQV